MPNITIEMFARPQEQKRELVKKVTEAVCEAISVPPEVVNISIHEITPENYANGGVLFADK